MIGSYIVAYQIQRVAEIFPQTANRLAYDTFHQTKDSRSAIQLKKGEAGFLPLLPKIKNH